VQGKANMKTILFDSLDEAYAQKLTGCPVINESGETVGTVDGLWMDSTSHRVELVGVKSSSFSDKVHLMPAREGQIIEEGYLIRLRYPAALIKKAPSFSAGTPPVEVEREKVDKLGDRNTTPPRIRSNEELRPEEAIERPSLDQDAEAGGRSEKSTDRHDLEKSEQAFFNQEGFVTDALPEVNASEELLRVQNEAKIRNREDRLKNGSLD
jgi:sporulation protein YlmC with PRC-barrel domain